MSKKSNAQDDIVIPAEIIDFVKTPMVQTAGIGLAGAFFLANGLKNLFQGAVGHTKVVPPHSRPRKEHHTDFGKLAGGALALSAGAVILGAAWKRTTPEMQAQIQKSLHQAFTPH